MDPIQYINSMFFSPAQAQPSFDQSQMQPFDFPERISQTLAQAGVPPPMLPPVGTEPTLGGVPGAPLDITSAAQQAGTAQRPANPLVDTLRGVKAPAAPQPQRVSSPQMRQPQRVQGGQLMQLLAGLGLAGNQPTPGGLKLPPTLGAALGR